ncbi:MAG: DUF420 domain-containing protein [Chloroflexi bacterium]|nr:DUF420 domain-containing protein [Chloroflexota bacterium]
MPTRVPAPDWVPLFNTSLIVISGLFLLLGYYFIRQRQIVLHKRSMLTATTFAALFVVVYVTRAMLYETKTFAGDGWVRAVYLSILTSHTILSVVIVPFVVITLRRALRGEYGKHRQVARMTFPMWLYVVVTGWLIYWMLHYVGGSAGA